MALKRPLDIQVQIQSPQSAPSTNKKQRYNVECNDKDEIWCFICEGHDSIHNKLISNKYEKIQHTGRNSSIYRKKIDSDDPNVFIDSYEYVKIVKEIKGWKSDDYLNFLDIISCYKILTTQAPNAFAEVISFNLCQDNEYIKLLIRMKDAGVVNKNIEDVNDEHINEAIDTIVETLVFSDDVIRQDGLVNTGNVAMYFDKKNKFCVRFLDIDDIDQFYIVPEEKKEFLKVLWKIVILHCLGRQEAAQKPEHFLSKLEQLRNEKIKICTRNPKKLKYD